jgi:hypothetical protein
MFIVILFLAIVLIMSCVLPDFSIASLKQIATRAFEAELPAIVEKKDRVPMRMPRARRCKVTPAELTAAKEKLISAAEE